MASYKLKRKMFMLGLNKFGKAFKLHGMANAAGNSIQSLQQKAADYKNAGNTTNYDATMKQIQQRQRQQQNYNKQAMSMAGKGVRNLAFGSVATVGAIAAGKTLVDKLTGEN